MNYLKTEFKIHNKSFPVLWQQNV